MKLKGLLAKSFLLCTLIIVTGGYIWVDVVTSDGTPASGVFDNLRDAMLSLVDLDGQLIFPETYVTILDSSLSAPQNLSGVNITGPPNSVLYIMSERIMPLTKPSYCDLLPTILMSGETFAGISQILGVAFYGVNIKYRNSARPTELTSMSQIIFQYSCLDMTEQPTDLPPTSSDSLVDLVYKVFYIAGVTSLKIADGVLIHDKSKEIRLSCVTRLNFADVVISANDPINDSRVDTKHPIISTSATCKADIYEFTVPNFREFHNTKTLPNFFVGYNISQVKIYELTLADLNFTNVNTSDTGFFFNLTNIESLEVLDFRILLVYFSANSNSRIITGYNISSIDIPALLITDSHLIGTSAIYLSWTNSTSSSMKISYLALWNTHVDGSASLIHVVDYSSGSTLSIDSISIMDCYFSAQGNIMKFEINEPQINSVDAKVTTVAIHSLIIGILALDPNHLTQTDLFYFYVSTPSTIQAVEVCEVLVHNAIIKDSKFTQANLMHIEGARAYITNFTVINTFFDAGSNCFLSRYILSTFIMMNTLIDNVTFTADSSFLTYSFQSPRHVPIEASYNNLVSIFAETRPLIVTESTFSNIKVANSFLIAAKNSMATILNCGFKNIEVNDKSSFIVLGGYTGYLSPGSYFVAVDSGVITPIELPDVSYEYFIAAESIIWDNKSEAQAVFDSSRESISMYDPQSGAVYFILVKNNTFENVSLSQVDSLISLTNFKVANSTAMISNNTISNLTISRTTTTSTIFAFFKNDFVWRTIFRSANISGYSADGYILKIYSDLIDFMDISSNMISHNVDMGGYLITGDSCNHLQLQDISVENVTLEKAFFAITCSHFNGTIVINNMNLRDMNASLNTTAYKVSDFFSITINGSSNALKQGSVLINSSSFNKINLNTNYGYKRGIFPSSIFSLKGGTGVNIAFTNVIFDELRASSSTNVILVLTQNVLIANSIFQNTSSYEVGVFNLVSLNLTIQHSIFSNNQQLGLSNGAGVFKILSPNPKVEVVTIWSDNNTFENNIAPFGTVLYSEACQINISLSRNNFSNNTASSRGGVFFFDRLVKMNMTIDDLQFNVLKSEQANPPTLKMFSVENSGSTSISASNCRLTVNGESPGVLFNLYSNIQATLHLSSLQYSSLIKDSSSFGILSSDNIVANMSNLTITQIQGDGNTPLFLLDSNTVNSQAITKQRFLSIINSTFDTLILNRSMIVISSTQASSTAWGNVSVVIQDSNFSNMNWSGTLDGGLIKSYSSVFGQDPKIYNNTNDSLDKTATIELIGCEFVNLSSSSSAVVFSGYRPIVGTPLLNIGQCNFANVSSNVSGGLISLVPNMVTGYDSSTISATALSRTISISNSSFIQLSSSSNGSLISYTKASLEGAISLVMKANNFSFIHASSMGGLIYIGSAASSSSTGRLLASNTNTSLDMVDITGNTVSNVTAGNGSFIFEAAPNNTLTINFENNNLSNLSATSFGGVFYLTKPYIFIQNNTFSNCSATTAGSILYSLSTTLNIQDFTSLNQIFGDISSNPVTFAPTNLKIEFISVKDSQPLLLENYENLASNPIVPDFTSYSLSEYSIAVSLITVNQSNGFSQLVLDRSPSFNVSMVFILPNGLPKVQLHTQTGCKNSTCNFKVEGVALAGYPGDLVLVNVTYSSNLYTQFQQFQIRLRECVPGEINHTATQKCFYCSENTYSLHPNDTVCHACPTGEAICEGGAKITVKKGYYRSTNSSELYILDCNDNGGERCLGGNITSFKCAESLTGPLCLQCTDGYLPDQLGGCSKCDANEKIIPVAVVMCMLMIVYQLFAVRTTYKGNTTSFPTYQKTGTLENVDSGALIVIFTSFNQLTSVLLKFNLMAFSTSSAVSTVSSMGNPNSLLAFYLQCFYYVATTDSLEALKYQTMLYVLSPIAKVLAVAIVEFIRKLFVKKVSNGENDSLKKSLVRIGTAAVGLVILEQPGIIGNLCNYLNCTQLDPYVDEHYVTTSLKVECYTPEYNFIRNVLVIPGLVFWGALVPGVILLILWKYRKELQNSQPLYVTFGNLYNTFNRDGFFWGVVIMNFKMLIFILDSLLMVSDISKVVIYTVVFELFFLILMKKPPHENETLNKAQRYCCVTYLTILLCAFFKLTNESFAMAVVVTVIVFASLVWSAGYVLWNLLGLYVIQAMKIIFKLKVSVGKKKVLQETFAHLEDYHQTNNRYLENNHRRPAISLELSPRYLTKSLYLCLIFAICL